MYRVLCLSGGGLRGVFQSELLARLQPSFGEFWKSFDLIVGTSIGSLLAAGLHLDISPERISEHYRRLGPVVFPQKLSWNLEQSKDALLAAVNRKTSGPVYRHTHDRLRMILNRFVGPDTRFRDIQSRPELAVTSTDVVNGKVRVFSPITWKHDLNHRIVDTLIASSAAPGLLPCCEIDDFVPDGRGGVCKEKRFFVDGGMWANSPILPAIVLAHSNRGVPFDEMRILSIGTGYKHSGFDILEYESSRLENSAFRLRLLQMAMSASSDAGDRAAQYLVGEENYLHIEPMLEPGMSIGLFDYRSANSVLPKKAAEAAASPDIHEFFARCNLCQLTN